MGDPGLGLTDAAPSRARDLAGPASAGSIPIVRGAAATRAEGARLRGLVDDQYDFIWRSLRRLGVPEGDADDCAQQVFLVASRKLDDIVVGCERPFLFSTALRVASDARRSRSRRREVFEDVDEPRDSAPDPEQIADQKRARALLDEVLDSLPMELRAVFVLYELEELPSAEIAEVLALPIGTVASRLRRAREEFQRIIARMKARDAFDGGRR
jgi:RNA polymerase sigma-70 factor (ECF subfamily)